MILNWLNAEEEKKFGKALAAYFIEKLPPTGTLGEKKKNLKKIDSFTKLLKKVDEYKHHHRLNFYKKSVLGNSFQWALIDAGFAKEFAKELTAEILLRI